MIFLLLHFMTFGSEMIQLQATNTGCLLTFYFQIKSLAVQQMMHFFRLLFAHTFHLH